MKLKLNRGTTSKLLRIFVQNSSSSSISGLTGLAYNSTGLTWYFAYEGGTSTAVTLTSGAVVGTWQSGGLVAVDATNMPGVYEIGVPNAALATGNSVIMYLQGATNMSPVMIEIELDAVNYQAASNFGLRLSQQPRRAASGGLPTIGTGRARSTPVAGLSRRSRTNVTGNLPSNLVTIAGRRHHALPA